MKYYKMLSDNAFIGIINTGNFVAENPRNHWLLTSNENLGQYVSYEGQLYRDYWMQPIPNSTRAFTIVQIIEIDKNEYDSLNTAIENNEQIIIEEEEEPIVEIPKESDITVEFMRESKLKEMSATCRSTIELGFDFNEQHYSLDTQDQLNLITLSALADTQEYIPYHADGQLCRMYSAAEIKELAAAATQFKIYNTTYYNALKAYINSLETIEEIAAVTYGMELPEEYQTDVLKAIV